MVGLQVYTLFVTNNALVNQFDISFKLEDKGGIPPVLNHAVSSRWSCLSFLRLYSHLRISKSLNLPIILKEPKRDGVGQP